MLPVDEPPITSGLIHDRLATIHERLRAAAERSGRDPDGFRVVAVTKGFDLAVVRAARMAGLSLFGENRVQEAGPKVAAVPDAEWHMIGRLQSNKVRQALGLFRTVHSVESIELLERIERIAHDDGHRPRLLLQVDTGAAGGRVGFAATWFAAQVHDPGGELVRALLELHAASVVGLMTMPPIDDTSPAAHFARLRRLRDELQQTSGLPLPELSMGMSADAKVAVAQGATLVRIGTAIFGPRPHR
ncbi:MAG TPA: YggS family pyridoxal phosphate-dependent enzyme [Candidatus Limnocylindria bacterium]|jgi:pyridoxal phosphate enzyme (YggS family)